MFNTVIHDRVGVHRKYNTATTFYDILPKEYYSLTKSTSML